MPKPEAIILIVAAFLGGALADRLLNWATTPNSVISEAKPAGGPAAPGSGSDPWDMRGCLASAQRRGMTDTEARHACQEIIQ